MYIAKARVSWAQNATLCCLIANANRDPKRKRQPFTPADFNPMASESERSSSSGGIPINSDTMGAVASAWTGKKFSDQPPPPLNLTRIERRRNDAG